MIIGIEIVVLLVYCVAGVALALWAGHYRSPSKLEEPDLAE